MHAEARRLGALIEDVEALAEAERPGVLMRHEPVDLGAAARERLAAHAAAFADAGIELRDELAREAVVVGDPARLTQVLDNLLTNALRYTDRGGAVTVAVGNDGDGVTVDVSDTGIGIAAEDLPHVFDRFWRADRSRSRATGGSGVGLAVVQRLIAAHGGRIEVDSQAGRGTSFHIWLPSPE
jgi:two-component system sensor histidine kinase BaeS